MLFRIRPSFLAMGVIAACVVILGSIAWLRSSRDSQLSELLRRVPDQEDYVKLYIDVAALRESGFLDLLAGTVNQEDAEYRDFVRRVGFDYRTDLDAVLAAFRPGSTLLLVKGRFQWNSVYRYTEAQGGVCLNGQCSLHGSRPDHWISFFPVTPGTLALASDSRRLAAALLQVKRPLVPGQEPPLAPVWLMSSGKALAEASWLPTGTRSFARALTPAERVVLSLEEQDGNYRATLRVDCAGVGEANRLRENLDRLTKLLASLIRREHKTASPKDLSGILTNGTFEVSGSHLAAHWPIPWAFIAAVTATG